MEYPYFKGLEADRYSFYRVPKALVKADLFQKMSGDAKLLYAVLLDRMSLSIKNGWQDKYGNAYIICTIFEKGGHLLTLTPINLKTANAFVQQYHRHHKPTRGHKFSIGVSENGALVGVAICGRPVARRLDDGYTLEVNRLCTDGTPNACSILYAAAYRAARAMGYHKVITYILDTENGTSLKAAGYTCEGRAGGLEWNGAKAPKQADQYPRQMKTRWVKKKEGLHGS